MILKQGGTIRGLTTAAGIWETAAVGIAVAVNCWLGQQVLTGPPQRGHVLSTKDPQQAGELTGVRPARQLQGRDRDWIGLQHEVRLAGRRAARGQDGQQRQALCAPR
jgi:hypothetical protein